MKRTKIGYADFSAGCFNFVIGCTPVSTECDNCYARTLIERYQKRDFSEVRIFPEKLKRLSRINLSPGDVPYRRGPGSRPIVFPVDLGDIFHRDVPKDFVVDAFTTMNRRSDIDWLILTKRPQYMAEFQGAYFRAGFPDHFWVGTTAGTQKSLRNRVPWLLATKASVRWLSMEPLLEEVWLDPAWLGLDLSDPKNPVQGNEPMIHWLAVGAESGPRRREFDGRWAEMLYYQAQDAGIAFFGKQDSGLYPGTPLLIEGQEVKEFPR